MAIVDKDVHRIAGRLVELDHRIFIQSKHILDIHSGAAKLDLDVQFNIMQEPQGCRGSLRILLRRGEIRKLHRFGTVRLGCSLDRGLVGGLGRGLVGGLVGDGLRCLLSLLNRVGCRLLR